MTDYVSIWLPNQSWAVNAECFLVQAEATIAAQQDLNSRAYHPTVSQSVSNNENTAYPNSTPSVSTFSPGAIEHFFQHSSNHLPATSDSLQEMNDFPLSEPMAWDLSNMLETDIPQAGGVGDMFPFGEERLDTSDRGYSSESSSQWPSVDSSSSSDQMARQTTQNKKVAAYQNASQNVREDL